MSSGAVLRWAPTPAATKASRTGLVSPCTADEGRNEGRDKRHAPPGDRASLPWAPLAADEPPGRTLMPSSGSALYVQGRTGCCSDHHCCSGLTHRCDLWRNAPSLATAHRGLYANDLTAGDVALGHSDGDRLTRCRVKQGDGHTDLHKLNSQPTCSVPRREERALCPEKLICSWIVCLVVPLSRESLCAWAPASMKLPWLPPALSTSRSDGLRTWSCGPIEVLGPSQRGAGADAEHGSRCH